MITRVILLSVLAATATAQDPAKPAAYPDPARFEKAIREFEAADRKEPPPRGAILFYGSSSIRMWHPMLAADMAPLKVIPRGFGGSNMNEALHFAGRVVLPCQPRAIVLYEGDNDIAQGIEPQVFAGKFSEFTHQIHAALPDCRIHFIAIKPSVSRWKLWPQMKQANDLIARQCAGDKRLTYIDIATPMLGADGRPRAELFKDDMLHMNRAGYEIWRDVLKPVLQQPATR